LTFPISEKLVLYGTSFEDTAGIIIDNFGLRGNSGIGLAKISDDMQMQFDSLQKYSVIILQYGLNVATPQSKDFNWYIKPMVNLIERLKKSHPHCSFILMSVSDRSVKKTGEYQTMESIPLMVETQRKIAQQSKIAFWDLYTAMGGENSMVNLVDSKPSLANKDYTHLNKSGGKKIAGIFVQTLLYELEKYEAKKNISIYNDSLQLLHK
jgi:lysophospholipase L1-like esterase